MCSFIFLGYNTCTECKDAAYCYRCPVRLCVCLSVRLCVCLLVTTKKPCIRWGSRSPMGMGSLGAYLGMHRVAHIWYKGEGSPYSIAERRVLQLIPVLGSQPAGDVSHKPGGSLSLLSARPAVTLATIKRAATSFAAWWTGGTMGVNSLPKTVTRQRRGCDLNPGPTAQHANHSATEPPHLIYTVSQKKTRH